MNIDTSNPEFQQALQIVNYTQRSLFLTGKADMLVILTAVEKVSINFNKPTSSSVK